MSNNPMNGILELLEKTYKTIEFYDVEECDPDVAKLLADIEKVMKEHPVDKTPVDEEDLDEWLEDVRKENISPLAP